MSSFCGRSFAPRVGAHITMRKRGRETKRIFYRSNLKFIYILLPVKFGLYALTFDRRTDPITYKLTPVFSMQMASLESEADPEPKLGV